MERMAEADIRKSLEQVPEWSETGGAIHRTYQFADFNQSMAFVNAVAAQAEADQHHPDILVRWNKVTLTLSTHDASGITEKDFAMAAKADALAAEVAAGGKPKAAGAGAKPATR